MTDTIPPTPTNPQRDKFLRFVHAGGDLATVPEDVWGLVGGPALRDKIQRFDAAGGDRSEVTLPSFF